jgi:hypothetical protein
LQIILRILSLEFAIDSFRKADAVGVQLILDLLDDAASLFNWNRLKVRLRC